MSQAAKILLSLVAGGLVLACLLCGGAALWFKRSLPRLEREARQSSVEARRYAADHTKPQCVEESIRRVRAESGLDSQVRARVFLARCLEAAPFDPAFCAGVPPKSDVMRAAIWPIQWCARNGAANDRACSNVVPAVIDYCSTQTANGPGRARGRAR